MQLFNSVLFNQGVIQSVSTVDDVPVSYSMQIRDRNGVCLAYLQNWSNAEVSFEINKPGMISFDYPALDEKASLLEFPNQVWLFNQDNTLIEKYHILPVEIQQSDIAYTLRVEAESLLYQLSKELVIEYATPDEETKTIKEIILSLLANQANSLPIYFGAMDPSIAFTAISYTTEMSNILNVLNDLYSLVNIGHFWINPDNRKIYWKNRKGVANGQQIRLGKNMLGVNVKTDYSKLVNRVYVYGNDNGETGKIKLTDMGHPTEYLQNTSSISTFGVLSGVQIVKDINDPDTLYKYAESFLDLHSLPTVSYEIDFVNLHASNPIRYAFEGMTIGSSVDVINEDLDLSSTLDILKIEHSLDNPLQMKITLGTKPIDLDFILSKVLERIATLEKQTMLKQDTITNNLLADGFLTRENIGTELLDITVDGVVDPQYDELYEAIDNLVEDYLADPLSNLATEFADSTGLTELEVQDLIDTALETLDIPQSATEDPESIVSTGDTIGDSVEFALANHTHIGMPFKTATDKDSLDAILLDGEIGYVTSGGKRGYMKVDGVTLCFTHLEALEE